MSFDSEWFGDCCNTFHEEQKQLAYAPRMGLIADWECGHPPTFDLGGRSVVDIGGGPASLLLKCVNLGRALVVDPAAFPPWVKARYKAHGVTLCHKEAEEFSAKTVFDEAWIYNVLQHVRDPALAVFRAQQVAKTIRIFEWIDLKPYPGHPHTLTKDSLEEWLGSPGFASQVNEEGAVGRAFYGVFSPAGRGGSKKEE